MTKKRDQKVVYLYVLVSTVVTDVHLSFNFAAFLYKIYFLVRLLQPYY
jgi:hypothetical protein